MAFRRAEQWEGDVCGVGLDPVSGRWSARLPFRLGGELAELHLDLGLRKDRPARPEGPQVAVGVRVPRRFPPAGAGGAPPRPRRGRFHRASAIRMYLGSLIPNAAAVWLRDDHLMAGHQLVVDHADHRHRRLPELKRASFRDAAKCCAGAAQQSAALAEPLKKGALFFRDELGVGDRVDRGDLDRDEIARRVEWRPASVAPHEPAILCRYALRRPARKLPELGGGRGEVGDRSSRWSRPAYRAVALPSR